MLRITHEELIVDAQELEEAGEIAMQMEDFSAQARIVYTDFDVEEAQ